MFIGRHEELKRLEFNTSITDVMGHVTTFGYDPKGNLTTITYPPVMGVAAVYKYAYNPYGQLITYTSPKNIITKYEYVNAKLTNVTQDYGDTSHINVVTEFGYDTAGNVTSIN